MNKSAMNICLQVFGSQQVFISLRKVPRSAEIYGLDILDFLKLPNCLSLFLYCFTFSPASDVIGVLDFSHSNRCVVASCFNLHFTDNMVWSIYSYAYLLYTHTHTHTQSNINSTVSTSKSKKNKNTNFRLMLTQGMEEILQVKIKEEEGSRRKESRNVISDSTSFGDSL